MRWLLRIESRSAVAVIDAAVRPTGAGFRAVRIAMIDKP
jgi:hypothetical protein